MRIKNHYIDDQNVKHAAHNGYKVFISTYDREEIVIDITEKEFSALFDELDSYRRDVVKKGKAKCAKETNK